MIQEGNGFTTRKEVSIRFVSCIDRKGRALISASLRKKLLLRYGSVILVDINGNSFSTKIDERGRFGVPKDVRGDSSEVEGVISVFSNSFSNGCDGVALTSEFVELRSRVKPTFSKKLDQNGNGFKVPVMAPFSKSRRCL